MPLSLAEAQTVVELARAHAEKIGVPMNIAVVDGGGHLLALQTRPITGTTMRFISRRSATFARASRLS